LLARYKIFGAYEPAMIAAAFLFPAASIVIFSISKRLADRVRAYQPITNEDWSFYSIQELLILEKLLFKGKEDSAMHWLTWVPDSARLSY
jgi:hypothetical protein